ncbi:MAG: asparagine--tRNA ligase, partial [Firmicutes bacterium]|nr:asparagine--tRNA ligase [Bacillota bacterium]
METTLVRDLYRVTENFGGKEVLVRGWVRNNRNSNKFGFIDLNDGSFFKSLQVVYEEDSLSNYEEIAKCYVGSGLAVKGILTLTPEAKQPFEIKATEVVVEGTSTPDYPLQPKRHSMEYLREIAYLRPRTNLFSAVFRVRSVVAYAIHKFFQERGFVYVHTPIITGSDAEGAGEMFRVTTLDLDDIPRTEDGQIDFSK